MHTELKEPRNEPVFALPVCVPALFSLSLTQPVKPAAVASGCQGRAFAVSSISAQSDFPQLLPG